MNAREPVDHPSLEPDIERMSCYWPLVDGALPRLVATLDRETGSTSRGSFDREHWAWKFRDFPITMLQAGIHPLALVWRHPFPGSRWHRSPQLLGWIEAAIEATCSRQRPGGAFDSVAPHTQDHGVSLAIVYLLSETVRTLGDALSPALRERICEVVRRAAEFACRTREDYAVVSNHRALFVLAFLNAHELLGEARYLHRAEERVRTVLDGQSPDGWYREYDGPDPGYESLGISFLAACWQRTHWEALLDSLRRSVDFYAHCVHPDGSVGGGYGSRQTALYFPAGFERLAGELPMARAVARFMRARLLRQNVLTPAASDAQNLAPLLASYLEACLVPPADSPSAGVPLLPFEALDGVRRFSDSGIAIAGRPRYYAVANTGRGGVCRVFDKDRGAVAYEDAGYVLRAGGRWWASQVIGLSRPLNTSGATVACESRLGQVRQLLPTPAKFVLLRLLNLTVFRSALIGGALRTWIVRRLITSKRGGPFRLSRRIDFDEEEIRIHDRLEALRPLAIEIVALPRVFTAMHMGSAKYFSRSELDDTLRMSTDRLADDLRRVGVAAHEFAVRFAEGRAPELVECRDAAVPPTPQAEALSGR